MIPTFFETSIPGCCKIAFPQHRDARGTFIKTVHAPVFAARDLDANFVETFYTISEANVLRGMHLQLPPADHAKLVYCMAGAVMDIALDLRAGSPSYGRFEVVELSDAEPAGLYLPGGLAHGFYVRRGPAVMMYHTTSTHQPAFDSGIRWDSFGAPWPSGSPQVSPRDAALPALADFRTPFTFEAVARGRAQ